MFCNNCGTKLEDGEVFCPNCGTKVEEEVATPVETATPAPEAAPVEEAPVNVAPAQEAPKKFCHNCGAANAAEDVFCHSCGGRIDGTDAPAPAAKANKLGGLLKKLPIVVAAVIAVVVVVLIGKVFLSGGSKSELIYEKDKGIFQLNGKEGVEIGSHLYDGEEGGYANVTLSEDGKYIYYPQKIGYNGYDLYYRKAGNVKADGEKISGDVLSYMVLDNNNVIFTTNDGKLMKYDFKDKAKIATDVTTYRVSEDQKTIMWRTSDDGKMFAQAMSLKSDKEKLDSDVQSIVYTSEDLKEIYYTKDSELYVMKNLKDKNKIASDVVDTYVISDDDNVQVIYTTSDDEGETVDLSDIIEDDFASDASMEEPNIEDYQHEETKDSWWGPRTTTVTDDAYYDAVEEYYAKQNRDYYREFIANELSVESTTLNVYDGKSGEKSKLFEGALAEQSVSNDVFLYAVIDTEGGEKVKLSKLIEYIENGEYDKFTESLAGSSKLMLYSMGKTTEVAVDTDDYAVGTTICAVDSKNKTCYIRLADKSDANDYYLLSVKYGKETAEATKIAEDFYTVAALADNGALYYICNWEDKSGELYKDGEKITDEVGRTWVTLINEGKSIAFLEDVNKDGDGVLCTYSNKKVKVAEDVYSYRVNEDGDIAYLSEYNHKKGKGDLYTYKSGKAKKVDEDVTQILYY